MSMTIARRVLPVLALFVLFAKPGAGDQPFVPIPTDAQPLYHFNFARNFFATPEAEKADRQKLQSTLGDMESLKGKTGASAANLLRAMELSDRVTSEFMRHYIYLYLRYATNTKDTDSLDAQNALGAELDRRTSFLRTELIALDDAAVAKYLKEEPKLEVYRFAIESARRYKPHTLSLPEEELLGATGTLMRDWQSELYQRNIDRTNFGKVHGAEGDLDVWKQQEAIRNSADRAVREAGFKKRYAGMASQRDLYAFALSRLVKARNQISQLRHYRDNPDEVHFGLYLTTDQVKNLFDQILRQGDFNRRYQRLRADRVKQQSGFEDVNVWDMTFIPPGKERPRFNIESATRVVEETLAPFGSDYGSQLAALLDPKHGRLDLVPGDNRVPGAFAWGFPGSQPSIFYDFAFEGYYDDVSTLIHESGHGVHFQLMGENHVIPSYADGPSYFTESFAIFNELLLGDQLFRNETDPFRKTYFLEQFMQQAMSVFGVTRQAAIEQAIYDGVAKSDLKNADDFDKLAKRMGSRVSIWFDKHDELKMEWIDVHHFYDNPMYYVNYVFAELLSLKYFEMYQRDREHFVPRYIALVRNGFSAPPAELLKKFLDIDLSDPNLVPGAVTILDGKIKALQELYGADRTDGK